MIKVCRCCGKAKKAKQEYRNFLHLWAPNCSLEDQIQCFLRLFTADTLENFLHAFYVATKF